MRKRMNLAVYTQSLDVLKVGSPFGVVPLGRTERKRKHRVLAIRCSRSHSGLERPLAVECQDQGFGRLMHVGYKI